MYVQAIDTCGNTRWYSVPDSSTLLEGDTLNTQLLPSGSVLLDSPPNVDGLTRCRQTGTTTTTTATTTTTGGTGPTTTTTTGTTATTVSSLCQRGPSIAGFQLKSNRELFLYYDALGVNVLNWKVFRIVNSLRVLFDEGTTDPLLANNFSIYFDEDLPVGDYDVEIKSPFCVTNLSAGQSNVHRFTVQNVTTQSTTAPVFIVGLYAFESPIGESTTTGVGTQQPLCLRGPSIYGFSYLDARRIHIYYDAQGVNNMNWTLRENNIVIKTGNTGVLTTNHFIAVLTADMQEDHTYEFQIDSVTCRNNSQGEDSNIRLFTYKTGLTQTTAGLNSLLLEDVTFNIISYNYLTGNLQVKVTNGDGTQIKMSIPGLMDTTVVQVNSIITLVVPQNARIGVRFDGTLEQNNNVYGFTFITAADLGIATTTTTGNTTTSQGTTTTGTTEATTTGVYDGIPEESEFLYSSYANIRHAEFEVQWNNGLARIVDVSGTTVGVNNNAGTGYAWYYYVNGGTGTLALSTAYGYKPGDRVTVFKVAQSAANLIVSYKPRATVQVVIGQPPI